MHRNKSTDYSVINSSAANDHWSTIHVDQARVNQNNTYLPRTNNKRNKKKTISIQMHSLKTTIVETRKFKWPLKICRNSKWESKKKHTHQHSTFNNNNNNKTLAENAVIHLYLKSGVRSGDSIENLIISWCEGIFIWIQYIYERVEKSEWWMWWMLLIYKCVSAQSMPILFLAFRIIGSWMAGVRHGIPVKLHGLE